MKNKRVELDKILKECALKLDKKNYDELCRTIWAILNGVTYEIKDTWSTEFLRECENVWFDKTNNKNTIIINNKNIIDFSVSKAKIEKEKKLNQKKAEIEKIQRDIDATINDFELDDEF